MEHPLPFRISGGEPPYVSRIEGCPDWATLFSHQEILAGTAPASDRGRTFFCTYIVTDSGTLTDPQTRSFGLRLVVGSAAPLVLPSAPARTLTIAVWHSEMLPAATGGVGPYAYSVTCAGGQLPPGMGFRPRPGCSPARRARVFAIPAPIRRPTARSPPQPFRRPSRSR